MAEKKKIVFGAAAGIGALVTSLLAGVYEREGGYSNHAADRGGATRYGVTQQVAREDGYKGDMRVFPQSCYEGEKNTCADKIYYESYIVKPGFVPILQADAQIGDEMVDTGINMGTTWPGRFLQQALNATCNPSPKLAVDGKVGKGTMAAFTACQTKLGKKNFCVQMVTSLDIQQKARYDAIVKANPSQKVFYRGWINHRIGNVDIKRCAD